MSWYIVDVESDGPLPGKHSMVCLGAVRIAPDFSLKDTFYGKTAPISELWVPEALAVSGFMREDHLNFPGPEDTMKKFADWVKQTNIGGRPIFATDNLAFDWKWVDYYMLTYLNENPFGFSGRRIGDIIGGLEGDLRFNWKKFRITPHTHEPVNDAIGNAEALIHFLKKHNIRI